MAAVTQIVITDAQATPVSHTFVPIGQDANGVWWWEDQSVAAQASIGNNRLSMQLVRAPNPAPGSNAGNRVNRVKLGLHTPKLEVIGNSSTGITPPPTVAYIDRANVEFILPDRSNLQDRKDVRKYVYQLMNESQLTAMVEQLLDVY